MVGAASGLADVRAPAAAAPPTVAVAMIVSRARPVARLIPNFEPCDRTLIEATDLFL
jgi:hypothetical protein